MATLQHKFASDKERLESETKVQEIKVKAEKEAKDVRDLQQQIEELSASMSKDPSASSDHEGILGCNEAGKRIKLTTDNGKVIYGTVLGMDNRARGEARYAIVIDITDNIIILNRKRLEAGIKACRIGSIIELLDDDDNNTDNDNDNNNDNDDDNSIDIKKKDSTSIAPTTPTTTPTVPLQRTPTFEASQDSTESTSTLKNSNNKNNSNNKHDINQKEKITDVDNDGNGALHSKELSDLIAGANFKSAEAKTDMLRLLENMIKPKTSTEPLGKDMKYNNRNINQRPKTNNQKKDVMSRRKFKQMATNYAELQFSSSFGDKMMQESEPTHSHFIGCLDGCREIFEVIMLLILMKTLAKPKLGRFRNCCFGYHKMLIKVSLPNTFDSVLMILITAQTSIPKYTKISTVLIHTIMLSMAKTRKGVF